MISKNNFGILLSVFMFLTIFISSLIFVEEMVESHTHTDKNELAKLMDEKLCSRRNEGEWKIRFKIVVVFFSHMLFLLLKQETETLALM